MQKLKSLKINHFSKNCRNEFNEFADYVTVTRKSFFILTATQIHWKQYEMLNMRKKMHFKNKNV